MLKYKSRMSYSTTEKELTMEHLLAPIALISSLILHLALVYYLTIPVQLKPNRLPLDSVIRVNLVDAPPASSKDAKAAAVITPKPVSTPIKAKHKPKEQSTPVKQKPHAKDKVAVPITKEKKSAPPKKTDEPESSGQTETDSFIIDDGSSAPGGGQSWGSLALDVENFDYYYYLEIIKNKISRNWIPPYGSIPTGSVSRVIIYFKILADGSISDTQVEVSSGISQLDRSALRAVLVSAPFPRLPYGFEGEMLGIHFGFECSY